MNEDNVDPDTHTEDIKVDKGGNNNYVEKVDYTPSQESNESFGTKVGVPSRSVVPAKNVVMEDVADIIRRCMSQIER